MIVITVQQMRQRAGCRLRLCMGNKICNTMSSTACVHQQCAFFSNQCHSTLENLALVPLDHARLA